MRRPPRTLWIDGIFTTAIEVRRSRLVAAILALQLLIPSYLLVSRGSDPLPSAFGWQMFTAHGDRYAAWVIGAEGDEVRVDVDSLLTRPRAELRLDSALPLHLCDEHPDAIAVRVQLGADSTTTPCR